MDRTLRRRAPGKINLGLHVLRRRGDGFHDIETVFLRIPWYDVVTVQPASSISMTCSDPDLPVDDRNTCVLAARLLARSVGTDMGVHIHLDKRVPYGAGLGSGSSDAAATLRLLVDLWDLEQTDSELASLALRVGSDVPFFLDGALAFGEGRGERLTPLDCDPTSIPPWIVVVVPPVHVSSGEAYRAIRPRQEERADLRRLVCSGDVEDWRENLVNDFEGPILARYPEIEAARDHLRSAGAAFAALTGSGSAVFGLFETEESARLAADSARAAGRVVWMGRTSERD